MLKSFTIRQQSSKVVSIYWYSSGIVTLGEANTHYFFDLFKKRSMDIEEMRQISYKNASENTNSSSLNTIDSGVKQEREGRIVAKTEKISKPLLEGLAGNKLVYALFSDHTLRFMDITDYTTVLFEMPVNVLNFSNILVIPLANDDTESCFYVVTVSTTDPDCFDVYFVDVLNEKLNRKLKQVQMSDKALTFGNIMQFEYIEDLNGIAVGYEDGSVCVFELSELFDEVENTHCIIHFSSVYDKASEKETECDHPLLCFAYSKTQALLYMGHAKTNCIFSYDFHSKDIDKVNHNDIFSVSKIIVLSDSCLLFSTWENGNVYRTSNSATSQLIETIFKIPEKPNIQMVDIDPTGDTTSPHPFKEAERDYNKITYLYHISKATLHQSYLDKSNKVLLKRYSQIINHDYVVIGLQSGAITIIQL